MEELHTATPSVAEQNSSALATGRLPYTSPETLAADTEPALFICQSVRDGVKFTKQITVKELYDVPAATDFTFDDIPATQ